MKTISTVLILAFFSATAFAQTCESFFAEKGYKNSGNFLIKVNAASIEGELLDSAASIQQVEPWFHPKNPLTQDMHLISMRHKFAQAFTFSADGKYVVIHHDIYPDAEQLTLRSLETGENLSSLLWRGKGEKLFDLSSVDFNGQSRRIVGLAENSFTDRSDSVVSWDGRNDNVIENIEIQSPQKHEYRSVVRSGNDHSFRSRISQDHPYYVRTLLDSSSKASFTKEYVAQIIDWQSKHFLNLSAVAVDYLNIIPNPFSARFSYAAILQDNQKNVQIMSFDKISQKMAKAAAPVAGFLSQARKGLLSFMGIKSKDSKLALPGTQTHQPLAVRDAPQFNSILVHDQIVKKVALSNWAPFVVTKTADGFLHIWNVKTGDKIGFINSPVQDFRLLHTMGLLVYVDNNGDLILYSILKQSQIASLSGFTYYYLDSHVETRAPGVVYITKDDGTVVKVTETILQESGMPVYDIAPTGIRLKIPLNWSYRTEIQTQKGQYLGQVYESLDTGKKEDRKQLILDIYALDGSGQKLASLNFPVHAFQSEFKLDPTGKVVVYTLEETKTGMLHLDRLLKDIGL